MRLKKVRRAAAAAVAGFCLVTLLASPVSAEPSGKDIQTFDCGGVETEINVAGRNGWVNGVKFQAVQLTGSLPTGETAFVKVFGGGKQLADPDAITCTQTFPDGFTIEVIAVPA